MGREGGDISFEEKPLYFRRVEVIKRVIDTHTHTLLFRLIKKKKIRKVKRKVLVGCVMGKVKEIVKKGAAPQG